MEDQGLKLAKENLETSMKQAKVLVDKMIRELGEVAIVEATLASHPWMKDGLAYLKVCTEAQLAAAQEILAKRATIKAMDLKVAEKVIIETELMSILTSKHQAIYTDYKKNVLANFAKIKPTALGEATSA